MKRYARLRYVLYAAGLIACAAWQAPTEHLRIPRTSVQTLRQTLRLSGPAAESVPTRVPQPRLSGNKPEHLAAGRAPKGISPSEHLQMSLSTPDSIAAFVEAPSLTPRQIRALWKYAGEKRLALRVLQDNVYGLGLQAEEVSRRAKQIQASFESKVASIVSAEELERFYVLKRQGRIGTYAIVLPGDGYRIRR